MTWAWWFSPLRVKKGWGEKYIRRNTESHFIFFFFFFLYMFEYFIRIKIFPPFFFFWMVGIHVTYRVPSRKTAKKETHFTTNPHPMFAFKSCSFGFISFIFFSLKKKAMVIREMAILCKSRMRICPTLPERETEGESQKKL